MKGFPLLTFKAKRLRKAEATGASLAPIDFELIEMEVGWEAAEQKYQIALGAIFERRLPDDWPPELVEDLWDHWREHIREDPYPDQKETA